MKEIIARVMVRVLYLCLAFGADHYGANIIAVYFACCAAVGPGTTEKNTAGD